MTAPNKHIYSSSRGFSLIEMLLALTIFGILSAIFISRITTEEVGGAERVLTVSAAYATGRQGEAVRLGGLDRRNGNTVATADPLALDFSVPDQTASLIVEGTDTNFDCVDDFTGKILTCLTQTTGTGVYVWAYGYQDDPIKLPTYWRVALSPDDMSGIPLIFNGTGGRGVLVTKIGFLPSGKAAATLPGSSVWERYPTGSNVSAEPSTAGAPFWAVYFIGAAASGPVSAVALAIHPSGLVERYRWEGSTWIGFNNR